MTLPDRQALATVLAEFIDDEAIPGASVALIGPRGWVTAHAGQVAHDDADPITDAVAFCIGSISKTLTAATVLRLRDDGRLALDDPLHAYVPEASRFRGVAARADTLTLRALLTHTSGLQGDAPSRDLRHWDPIPLGDVLASPTLVARVIPPGSFKYSNLGYELLGEVIARVAGRPYGDVVRSSLLEPLGMISTALGPALPGTAAVRARGLGPPGSTGRAPAGDPPSADGAAGGWWSGAADLARWSSFQFGGLAPDVLADATLIEMHRATVRSGPAGHGYGLGWRIYRHADRTTIGHGGLTTGFETRIELDPTRSEGVVVLLAAVGPADPAARLAGQLLGRAPSRAAGRRSSPPAPAPPPAPSRGASESQSDIEATFQEVGFEWTVAIEAAGASLRLVDGQERWTLVPTAEAGRYVIGAEGRLAGESLVVLRDDHGRVDGINIGGYPLTRIRTIREAPMDRTVITSPAIPSSGKPYSPAIRHGGTLYVSGQVALDPRTGAAMDGGFEVQARRVLDNLLALLAAGGSGPGLVLKTTCFLVDIADAPRFNEIYREYFPTDPPARSTFAVAALSSGFLVEIEAIAAVADA